MPINKKKIEYTVSYKGISSGKIKKELKLASDLERLKTHTPGSIAALRHRAYNDVPHMIKVLHAFGYYDACITTAVKKIKDRYKVYINVDLGTLYNLKKYEIDPIVSLDQIGKPFDYHLISLKKLNVKLNRPATSMMIVEGEEKLLDIMTNDSYPLSMITKREVLVDQAKKTVSVSLFIDDGPQARFGKVEFYGLKSVKKSYVENRISWEKGKLFDPKEVARTQRKLYETGLFSTVNITHSMGVDENGYLEMYVTLTEGKHNSISLGGTYHTTWEGFGGIIGWQNKNIYNSAVNFGINVRVNQKKQAADVVFTIPDFIWKNQDFSIIAGVKRELTPNYLEHRFQARMFIERFINRYITMSLGLKFDELHTKDPDNTEWFSLVAIPYHFNYQSADNLLINPIFGGWVNFKVSPYKSLSTPKPAFVVNKIAGAFYFPLAFDGRIILAQSLVFSTVANLAPRMVIPQPYRFYAGSEHHLRGYPYQSISPLDRDNHPIGGRSMILMSVEPRFRITKQIEFVGFLDVGNVYVTPIPEFSSLMLKSIGVGARYLTFIGPLRLDVGFPLNKRPNIKKKVQVYFSIGQAF